ncbi:type IX secretion system periplasmic lipoprotein PorW/SprE [Pedobacter ureilyticus]|uniref:Tetratricopeptide repeat protein n=1 Tax=Pedobacter ureilyticus TaxID=1393051 RepID=A0ABW9J597_9SPHI|nr:tetratricopeptide repeat protein [Pedobacter helvus]
MNTYRKHLISAILCSLLLALILGCSSQKDTVVNRKLQNLSARYNLIYNSNVLLDEYLEGVNQSRKDNFDNFLPLYHAPAMADVTNAGTKVKELDEVDQKARTIIAEKNISNYIDDAYILLGKTNFYQGKYYNARSYFDYVASAYQKNHDVYLNALNWKARSFIELDDLERAESVLDTVIIELDSVKRHKAEPLATLAQINILKENDPQAIDYLEKALKAGATSLNKIRWTYTLAQLYESEKQYDKSLAAYRKVEKSNAAFDMYFNAKLSRIRVTEQLSGNTFDRKLALSKMLKDDKNEDFKDQIYYEIAEDYYAGNDYDKAEEYYNLSIKNSTTNNVQKALSYLKIADLNFKHYSDYVTAKLYYDSTALTLPKTHPLYEAIANKAQNLAYLQQRYETINLQDTLQKIAALPAADRPVALNNYFTSLEPQTASSNNAGNQQTTTGRANVNYTSQTGSTFYFANANAVSRGFNEFKKRWGNRKLAPNWRQSVKSSQNQTETLAATTDNNLAAMPQNPDTPATTVPKSTSQSNAYLDSIPLTPVQLEASNQKIINAYLEMGSFYQQVLNDKPEAIKTYETLLKRFPNNGKLDMIYYSLYLAHLGTNNAKANEYKNLVLSKFPNSVFAKTILDPNFSLKQSQLEATLNKEYEIAFNKLQERDFKTVIANTTSISQRFPGNAMEPQYDYLKAIAIGRTENVDYLIAAFKDISERHQRDSLIKPLVDQHLLYINAHLAEFKKRKIALPSYDPNEIPFAENKTGIRLNEPIIANILDPTGKKKFVQPAPPLVKEPIAEKPIEKPIAEKKPEEKPLVKEIKKDTVIAKLPVVEPKKDSVVVPQIVKKDTIANVIVSQAVDTIKPVVTPEPAKETLFNPASSNNYYYIVAINDVSLNVSTSRFGIGQFNRASYSGNNLRHQLKELEQDQLIIVGDFSSIADVQQYQQQIKSQLGRIIKIPAANYTTFAISKENLDKITNRDTLERYIRYINNNEL